MRFFTKSNLWLLAALVAGCLSLNYGFQLATWRSAQVEYYNQGLAAYQTGDVQTAAKLFDQSIAAYKQQTRADWLTRFVYPHANVELAAQANFHKAKALLRMRQGEPAVEAFKESLKLNPGNGYRGVSLEDAERLREQAMIVKYDLELLYKNNPQMGQGQGKGGKGNKPGQGNKQVPGDQPGTQPGKGDRDKM